MNNTVTANFLINNKLLFIKNKIATIFSELRSPNFNIIFFFGNFFSVI